MQSTTLKLPDALKARITPLADAAGLSPHAWMLQALQQQADFAEQRRSFVASALDAAREVDATARALRADELHDYVRSTLLGHTVRRPRAVKI